MTSEITYDEFLEQKRARIIETGFNCVELPAYLFDFQEYIVRKSLKIGKYAVFADCGLGKTIIQLVWAREVCKHTELDVLILCPLAVSAQTIKEGKKFGIEVRRISERKDATDEAIYISNYEQLENIEDLHLFGGIVVDESSIIKSFDGVTRNLIIDGFKNTQFKLACTATPSPNDPMELGNHAEFLNVMSYNEMLSMYFVHDGGDTAKWRLKGHSEKVFWQFVSTWAIMLSKPSDIGFSAEGYDLPPLNYIEKKIITDSRDNGQLFNDVAISATTFNAELRLTKLSRLSEVIEIVNNSTESFIIWIKQNEEGDYLKKLIPDAIEVRGSDSIEYKEEMLMGFAENKFRVLISKYKIISFGLNYQNCHNHVYPSLDFSFEGLYQAIRRSYRFGQLYPVNAYIVTTDTMTNVIQSIKTKQDNFQKMQREMTAAINLNLKSKIKVNRKSMIVETPLYKLSLGDSVKLIDEIEDNSLGFSMFSPPFSELYVYSDELEDMGNSKNYDEFIFAFKILINKLFNKMWSGRNVAVHCMDLPIQKGKEGYIGLRDFSGMILRAFEDAGFIYHSRVTIWKSPVTEMTRTKALGLLHKQIKKDAAMSRVGLPDYVMVFRKPGEHLHPVKCDIPVEVWQKYASPVWMDIDYSKTLNGRAGRSEKDGKHICPLQLPTIERATHLWSNAGDTCYTPFGGIGSEPFQWLKMKRKAIAGELKKSYFDVMVKNCAAAVEGNKQLSLLDYIQE